MALEKEKNKAFTQYQLPDKTSEEERKEEEVIVQSPSGAILKRGEFASPNYKKGVSGWMIDAEGNVEFNDGNFRGDISGATGTFRNINITRTLTADENLVAGDVVYPTGNDIVKRVAPSSFASNSATWTEAVGANGTKILKIDTTRTLHVSGGSKSSSNIIRSAIGTVNAGETDMTYGALYQFPDNVNPGDSNYFDVCQFDTTKFLVIYRRSVSNPGGSTGYWCVVLDVGSSGTTITAGTEVRIMNIGDDTSQVACVKVDTSRVAVAYTDNADAKMYIQVLSISGTTITQNTAVNLDANANTQKRVSLAYLTTNKLLCVYAADAADPLVAKTIDISGTVPTINGSNTLDANTHAWGVGTMATISATKVALVYSSNDGAATLNTNVAALTISGSTVTKGTSLLVSSTSDFGDFYNNVLAVSSTVLLTALRTTSTEIKYVLMYLDGTTITSTATQAITTAVNTYASSWVCKFKPFKYTGMAGHQESFVTFGSSSNKFIGVARESIADIATGDVSIRYNTNTTFTGIIAGSIYYIDDDARPSTESSTLSVTLGIGLNTTSILVQ